MTDSANKSAVKTESNGYNPGDLSMSGSNENNSWSNSFIEDTTTITNADWSDSAKELLESLPQVWTRGLLYFLMTFAGVIIPWGLLSKVDETGAGRGKIEPKGSSNRLEAGISGTVVAVRAKEGDTVKKGQILLELEADTIRSDLQQAQTKLEGQKNRLSQFFLSKNQIILSITTQQQQNQAQSSEKLAQADQAKQNLLDKRSSEPLVETSATAQIRQAEKSLFDSKSALLIQQTEKMAQVNQARQKLNATRKAYELTVNLHNKNLREVNRYKNLYAQGVVPETKLVEIEALAAESERGQMQNASEIKLSITALKEQESNYAKVIQQLEADVQRNEFQSQEKHRDYQKLTDQQKADIRQASIRLREQQEGQKGLKSSGELAIVKGREQLNDLQSQIGSLQTEVAQSEDQIRELQRQQEMRIMRAPIEGTVLQLPFKQTKSFVQTGQLVAQIASKNSDIVLKTQMPSQESGFLKVGMPVKVKFDAYPFQDYGIVTGRIQWLSPDSKIIENSVVKQEVFEVDITLDQKYIENREKRIDLSLGQTATAEVIVRQRRIGDFILDPFKQLQKGGLKL
jgi:hemolysin D